jgi:transposase
MSRTTTAPVSDDARTTSIHEGLKQKELLPEQHIVDTGYVDAQLLHSSQQNYGIDLVGPTRPDVKWQAQQKMGFAAAQFHLDWQAEQATCPEGHTSMSWTPAIDNRKNEVIKIKFSSDRLPTLPQSCIVYALHTVPAPHHHGAS